MSHDLILQHLKGATAQTPVTLEQLVEKTGLLPDTISMILDQMQKNGLAYIESFDERTYPKRGRWALTEKGRAVLAEQMKGSAA